MHFRDLDRVTPAGQQLMARLAECHGEPIADAARALDRLFLLGSDWAPGFCFVGGRTAEGVLGSAGVFSVAGAGAELEDALASASGEAIERMAQVERTGDVSHQTSLDQADLPPDLQALAADMARPGSPIDLVRGSDALTGAAVHVPADWCLRRTAPGPLRMPGAALSTGAAAGRTADDAATRAILELVERDAAALWWVGGRPARRVVLDEPALAPAIQLLATYRRGATHRQTQLFDISSDLEIPVMAAVSTDADGGMFACGLGCRLSRADAAMSALNELCQSEIGIQFADAKREQLGEAALSETDRSHLARAALVSVSHMPVYDAPARPEPDLPQAGTRMFALAQHLAARGVTAVLVDLTRGKLTQGKLTRGKLTRGAVPVVKAVAPELQQYPSDLIRPRLQRTLRDFGGAAHWTSGCSLV